ncbi:MAG TPA: hypothetical protein VN088_06525 [Nocardioides sp.]|nr:hypothetical protein [Nocardioides sp.]
MYKALVALALTLVGLVATSPADAATTSSAGATLTTRGAYVAPHACTTSRAGFKVAVDPAAVKDLREWSANVTITGPGRYRDTGSLYGGTDNDHWQGAFFCGSPNRAGIYTVRARLDIIHDTSYVGTHTYQTLTTTFRVWTRR